MALTRRIIALPLARLQWLEQKSPQWSRGRPGGRRPTRWSLVGKPQEPGEPPLSVVGVPELPDLIPRSSDPGGIHRYGLLSLRRSPAVSVLPS